MHGTRDFGVWWWVALGLVAALGGGCDSGRHGRGTDDEGESARGGKTGSRALTVKGSDTMVIIAQRWAEAYMKSHPEVSVQVSGGGSGTGIAALLNGTTDIANASREMKASEREHLRDKQDAEAHETAVALDAVAVYVHKENPIESLTIPQLEKIYRAKTGNWKGVGEEDRRITLYGRENNSGTYVYFKEQVLGGKDFAPETQTLPGTSAVINAVSKDEGAIGYGGIGYAEGVRTIPVAAEGGEPVEPTLENATSGAYPLSRPLYVYTAGEPEGLVKGYIEFMLSPEGQELVEGAGYYPLPNDADDAPTGGDAPEPSGHGDEPSEGEPEEG